MTRISAPYPADHTPPLLCPDLRPVIHVHDNPWFKVLSRGTYYTFEFDRPQVVVLPVIDRKAVVMVRVRRPLIGDTPLELPAGDSHGKEAPLEAAVREFAEETGILIKDPARFLPEIPISEMPGRMPVLLSVFRIDLARREFDERRPHDDEIVSVEAISYRDIIQKITSGEIYLSSPMALLARHIFLSVKDLA